VNVEASLHFNCWSYFSIQSVP